MTPVWLEQVYADSAAGKDHRALDCIFDNLGDLFDSGKFTECDAILREVDVNRLDVATCLGFLTSTLCATDKLPSRADLYDRVEAHLRALVPDRVEQGRLLQGLRFPGSP